MKFKKSLIPLIMMTPLLLISCGGTGGAFDPAFVPTDEITDFAKFKEELKANQAVLLESEVIKEYKIIFDQNKQYFDSVKHTFHTQTLTVDFNEYRIYMEDVKDDHNGQNLYQGWGKFWFWLDSKDNYAYHIAMINECDKNTHDIIRGGLNKNKELIALKSKIETPSGTYGNPRNYTLNLYQTLIEIMASKAQDSDFMKDATFTYYTAGQGNFIFKYNLNEENGSEYSGTYVFENYLMKKESYHRKTRDYLNDYSIEYELDDYDLKLPNPNLFK